jgi:hypothetical protein
VRVMSEIIETAFSFTVVTAESLRRDSLCTG